MQNAFWKRFGSATEQLRRFFQFKRTALFNARKCKIGMIFAKALEDQNPRQPGAVECYAALATA
jgi:hypothetical protein